MKIAVIFVAVVLACIPLVARSFFKNEELKEKYFSVQDIFSIVRDGVKYCVLVGRFVGGTLSVGDELNFYKTGEKTITKVLGLERPGTEHLTSVAENVDIAVWLDKDLSKQIKPGDKLYYKQ